MQHWANSGFITFRTINIQPMVANMTDTVWIDNDAVVGHSGFLTWYATMTNKSGHNSINFERMTVSETENCAEHASPVYWGNPWTGGPFCQSGFINWGLFSFTGQTKNENLPNTVGCHLIDFENKDVRAWYFPGPLMEFAEVDTTENTFIGGSIHDNHPYNHNGQWSVSWGYNQIGNPDNTVLMANARVADNSQGATNEEVLARSTAAATDAGAMQFWLAGAATIQNCEFLRNIGVNGGAAIGFNGPGSLSVYWSLFQENYAFAGGGAIYFKGAGGLNLHSCVFD
eukprot:COSAG05_NODE_4290_length_1580_cov_1.096556_2_plen_284_part_01